METCISKFCNNNTGFRTKTRRQKYAPKPVLLTHKNLSQRNTMLQLERPIKDGAPATNPLSWFNGRVILDDGRKYKIRSETLNRIMSDICFTVVDEIEDDIIIKVV